MKPNVALIVLDDAGYGDVGCNLGADAAITPNIDAVAANGWRSESAYSDGTVCSPTRAGLLTGEYGFRHGIGWAIRPEQPGPSMPELGALPHLLAMAGYHSGVAGKWHLASSDDDPPSHPGFCGFEQARIVLGNVSSYSAWTQYNNGAQLETTGYLTSSQIDDAIALVGELCPPRFLYVPLTAPHSPYHNPPQNLHPYGPIDPHHTRLAFKAALSAADTEIGRLLEILPGDWRIIILGDNGTPKDAQPPGGDPTRAKTTTFQGGIHVPLICSHALGSPTQLRNTVDVFSTILDWAGVDPVGQLDSVSMLGATEREWIFSSFYKPNGPIGSAPDYDRCVFDGEWKLRRVPTGDELYDVLGEDDGPNVAEANPDELARLQAIMSAIGG